MEHGSKNWLTELPVKITIEYSDGNYWLEPAQDNHAGTLEILDIDDRDWDRYLEFKRISHGWAAFIADMERPKAYGPYMFNITKLESRQHYFDSMAKP